MKKTIATIALVATALAAVSVTPAHADWDRHGGHYGGREWHGRHGDGGLLWGVFAAGAAVTGAAAALVAAPFDAVAAAAAPPPPPVYTAPAYYYPPQAYYYPRQTVVYSYPQPYGYHAYYAYGR